MNTLPPLYSFIDGLIRRAQPSRVICIGDDLDVIRTALLGGFDVVQFTSTPGSGGALLRQELRAASAGTLEIRHQKLQRGLDMDAALLDGAVVIALDIVDRLVTPAPLLKALGAARAACRFMLVSATDRVRAAGFKSGSKTKSGNHPKWSGEEFFSELVRSGFPRTILFGFTSAHLEGQPKDLALAIAGVEAEHGRAITDFSVGAVMNVFNEVDALDETVRHLAGEDVEVHVIDNWSEDGTYELAQSLLKGGLIKSLSRFPEHRTGEYEWARQLAHASEFAASLEVDWLLHYDADEIRISPWEGISLREAISHVDRLGYTAIDFTVVDFRFTAADRTGDPLTHRKHFEFARHPSSFVQVKGWKNRKVPVDLATHGGHEALFAGQRVFPLKFLTKHYSLRSPAQATRKVFRDRLPRIGKEKAERGWHVHFDQYQHLDRIEPWSDSEVLYFDERNFGFDFLLERLGGVGISREERVTLNRNTSALLHDVTGQLANRASALQFEITARDDSISELNRRLGQRSAEIDELLRQTVELDRQLALLKEARFTAHAQIEDLGKQLAERAALVTDLKSATERRDAQIESLHQVIGERDRQVTSLAAVLADRENRMQSLTHALGERDSQVNSLGAVVGERDQQIFSLNAASQAQAQQLHALQQAVQERQIELQALRALAVRHEDDLEQAKLSIAAKHRDVNALQAALEDREHQLNALKASAVRREQEIGNALSESEAAIRSLRTAARQWEREASSLSSSVSEARLRLAQQEDLVSTKNADLERLQQQLLEHAAVIERLHLDVGHRDRRIEALTHSVAERAIEVRYLQQGVKDARGELEKVLASKSWQLTKPLRFLRRNTLTRLNRTLRKTGSDVSRWCWYNAPVQSHVKQRFKGFVFSNFPTVFRGTVAYRSWTNFTASHSGE
jgi:hypothetical protein